MSEKLSLLANPDVSSANKSLYRSYKWGVDVAKEHEASMTDNSLKGLLKRGANLLIDGLTHTPPNVRHSEFLQLPDRYKREATAYYKENEDAVKLDAIHDATAAGVELNLSENGLPETATNVQPIPAQEQKNS